MGKWKNTEETPRYKNVWSVPLYASNPFAESVLNLEIRNDSPVFLVHQFLKPFSIITILR